jgi:protease-4
MSDIWLGTEESYMQALSSLQKVEAYQLQHGVKASVGKEDDEDLADYLQVVDGVGVITVSGGLVEGSLGWLGKHYNVTGYGDIQKAAIAAVSDPEVESILLNIKSGGGSVAGVKETAELLSNIDKIKPVTTYSPTYMGSAALWLGLSGREIAASETAIVGSIGALIVMTSKHRMLKDGGVDAVVVRSGKYKALGHPAEPITDEALASAQEKADYLGNIFLDYVAYRRGVSKAAADSKFGQGREFIGQQAKAVGLVDKISTYPEAFTRSKALVPSDNRSRIFSATMATDNTDTYNSVKPKGQNTMHIPTPEELATMAGVDLTADAAIASAEPEANASQEAQSAVSDAGLAALQAELQAANEAVAAVTSKFEAAQAELAQAKASAETASAQTEALAEIVLASVKAMTLSVEGSTVSASAVPVQNLAAKHAEISAKFKAKYRAGGITASAQKASAPAPAAAMPPVFSELAMSLPGAK